jgi:putative Mg2+ transporter-C (MgtC) family protein
LHAIAFQSRRKIAALPLGALARLLASAAAGPGNLRLATPSLCAERYGDAARFLRMAPEALQPSVNTADVALRLVAAVVVGMVIGLDREWRNKPVGVRTLALVSLGSALVALGTVHLTALQNQPDAVSRVVQGIIQGVMAGIGFIGAGAVLRRPDDGEVHNLTTAATVWVTAALGIACGLATWEIVAIGAGLTLVVLIVLNPIDGWVERMRVKRGKRAPE